MSKTETIKPICGCGLVEYCVVAKWFLASLSFSSSFCSSREKAGLEEMQPYTLCIQSYCKPPINIFYSAAVSSCHAQLCLQ